VAMRGREAGGFGVEYDLSHAFPSVAR